MKREEIRQWNYTMFTKYLTAKMVDFLFNSSFNQNTYMVSCHLLQKIVDEQIRTYDASHERHFIDMYITKMRNGDANPEEKSNFTCKFSSFQFISCLW